VTNLQENIDNESNTDDVMILESADVENISKALCPLSIENKYYSLMPILSKIYVSY
jgi:predicted nuclease with TOPRIM domain